MPCRRRYFSLFASDDSCLRYAMRLFTARDAATPLPAPDIFAAIAYVTCHAFDTPRCRWPFRRTLRFRCAFRLFFADFSFSSAFHATLPPRHRYCRYSAATRLRLPRRLILAADS